jgi:hypothetical protein
MPAADAASAAPAAIAAGPMVLSVARGKAALPGQDGVNRLV